MSGNWTENFLHNFTFSVQLYLSKPSTTDFFIFRDGSI